MDETLAEQVRERAGYICEYCHLPESVYAGPFEIEHVIAKQYRIDLSLGIQAGVPRLIAPNLWFGVLFGYLRRSRLMVTLPR